MNAQERRATIRQTYDHRCGYCGVHEDEAGSELELDHFQPRSAGGTDDVDNLVYCCARCNRLKGDFWAGDDPIPSERRLLHPRRDDLSAHIREDDCRLVGLTTTGSFHIDRLQLNRPPLTALRRARQENARAASELANAREAFGRLQARIDALERETEFILARFARLRGE